MRCIEKLSELLTRRMPDETILIVRNLDEGRRLITECAGTGAVLVGVRAATPFMLAQEICASRLAGKDAPRLLTKGAMQDLFFRSLLEMPEEGFFAKPHVRERKTAEMLLATISELNRELAPALAGNERLEAVQRLREYWQEVKGSTMLDESDLIWMAIRTAEEEHFFQNTGFVILNTEIIPKLDRKLVDLITEGRLTVVPVEVPEGVRVPVRCIAKPEQTAQIHPEELQFWRCRGIETEQNAIMRDILSTGKPAEDCAIVYMSSDYVTGLYAAANSLHLPLHVAEGIPMTESTVYDVLKLAQTWALSDYNAEELRRPVLAGALKIASGRRFCRDLRDKNIGWGKDRYALLLKQDENGYPDEETADNWRRTIDLLFMASQKSGTVDEQKKAVKQLLNDAVGIRKEEDASALVMAASLLEQITWLEETETVLDRLIELAEQSSVPVKEKAAGSILAVSLAQAFCTGRKVLYFCGLARFSMQSGAVESPILLDEERKQLNLVGKQEKEIQTTFLLLLSLVQHEGKAVLSYNDYDMERMNPLSPAPVYRSLCGEKEIRIVSCVPEEPLTIGDLISAGRKIRIRAPEAAKLGSDELKPQFTLHEEKSYEDMLKNMAFSASSMETALSCPFKFYMQKFVGLYPPAIPERRNDSWLDANEMGSLCHAVLEQYYRNPDEGWESILKKEIEKLKKVRPEGPESAVNSDIERAGRMIGRAVTWTASAERQVAATEKKFGKNANEEPLEIRIGDRMLRLSGSIDRIDRTKSGTLAILDYKTGAGKSYRENLDVKLQQYLYTRAAETLNPDQLVSEGGYLFLRDAADYLPLRQDPAEREKKERTVLSLLDWLSEEERAMIAAPAFVIQNDGSFSEPGSPDARKRKYEKCREYCEFATLCPAKMQIRREEETESREVTADE